MRTIVLLSITISSLVLSMSVSAVEDVPKLIQKEILESSITVSKDHKKVVFESLLVYTSFGVINTHEINCENGTLALLDMIVRPFDVSRPPLHIVNETEKPKLLLKNNEYYHLYVKYC